MDTSGHAGPTLLLDERPRLGSDVTILSSDEDLVALYARAPIDAHSGASVVAVPLTCAEHAPLIAPPGPCDVRRTPLTASLAREPEIEVAAVARVEGGYAVLRTSRETADESFTLLDREWQPVATAIHMPFPKDGYYASLAQRRDGWMVAWTLNGPGVYVRMLDRGGKPRGDPVRVDSMQAYGKVGLLATGAGVVVAWSTDAGIRTALLDGDGKIVRRASTLGHGAIGGDIELATLNAGVALLMDAPTGNGTEDLVLSMMRIDARGLARGDVIPLSSAGGYLGVPRATPNPRTGGLVIAAFASAARGVDVLELDWNGQVMSSWSRVVDGRGFLEHGVQFIDGTASVFAIDGSGIQERRLCGM